MLSKRYRDGTTLTPADVYGFAKKPPTVDHEEAAHEETSDSDSDNSSSSSSSGSSSDSDNGASPKTHTKDRVEPPTKKERLLRSRPSSRAFEERRSDFKPIGEFDADIPDGLCNMRMVAFALGATQYRSETSPSGKEVGYMWFIDRMRPGTRTLSWDNKVYGHKAVGGIESPDAKYAYVEFIQKSDGRGEERKTCMEISLAALRYAFDTAYAIARGLPPPRPSRFIFENFKGEFKLIDPLRLNVLSSSIIELVGHAIGANTYRVTDRVALLWHNSASKPVDGKPPPPSLHFEIGETKAVGDRARVHYLKGDWRVAIVFLTLSNEGKEVEKIIKCDPRILLKRCHEILEVSKALMGIKSVSRE